MFNPEVLIPELAFKAVRSSGSGGQHVNKVSSKVELQFNVAHSSVLAEEQKEMLYKSLASRLTKENVLILQCDESRSQHRNKELVISRFLQLVQDGLKRPKKRRPTKPTKSAVRKRLESKQKKSAKKEARKRPDIE